MIKIKDIEPHIKLGVLDLDAFAQTTTISQKRNLEKAGTTFLLQNLLNTSVFEVQYSPSNKPFLKNNTEHISISHSHSKLVILINEKENTGIDIELIRDKILNIQHKFLNDKEAVFANKNVETLTYIWAAKETLYKIYGLKGLDFKLHLSVEMNENESVFFGTICKDDYKKRYLLKKEKLQNYCLVYALNEI